MRRTRRCPTMAMTDEAIRNDSIPMSRKRWRADTESVACRDDRTRWPVRADCTAIRAVSTSRISPTRMTSGSWRRMDFRPVAKVRPACSLVWIWLIDGKMYSTGSSMVMTLRVGSLTSAQGGVQRRRLAAARRSGAQHHAEGRLDQLREGLVGVRRHAEVVEAEDRPVLVEDPHHALLAPDGGGRRRPGRRCPCRRSAVVS